jgi:hypothetical protein
MIEVRNKNRFPVQLVVRSRKSPRSFTTLNVPGMGSGKNVILLEDERATEYVDRLEKMGLISTKHLTNQLEVKGE